MMSRAISASRPVWQPHRAGQRIQPCPMALGTNLPFLRPIPPAFLDGIRVRAALHVGQIKQFAEAATFRTPALCGVVGKVFWIQRLERTIAFGTRTFGRVNGEFLVIVQGEQCAVAELKSIVNQLGRDAFHRVPNCLSRSMGRGGTRPYRPAQHAHNNLHIMFAKAIQAKGLAGVMNFPVGPDFSIAMFGGPLRNVGMKSFSVLHNWREQQQIAASLEFGIKMPGQFVAGLCFDWQMAIRTRLRSESCEEQADEMINLRDGRHRAFAAAARGALLDTDGRRNAGDEINVGPRHLLDELPGIDVHRIEKAPLAFVEQEIERQRAFARTAHASYDDEFVSRDFEREVFEIVFARAGDGNGGQRRKMEKWKGRLCTLMPLFSSSPFLLFVRRWEENRS